MWRRRQGSVLDEGAQRPCLREHVHILVLQRRRHDEVTAAAKDASSLWSLYMFAPAGADLVAFSGGKHMPVACGPCICLPPLKATRPAAALMNAFKLNAGGISAAASTSTGRLKRCAISTYSPSESTP